MGKIILNNIEYGTGTPNSSNVDTTNLVEKDSIVTVIDENVTDEQIPSAKAVHTVIQNVNVSIPVNTYTKEEVNNLLDGKVNTDDLVDAYSKDEVNNLLDTKADSTDIIDAYSKTEVDNLLNAKADSSAIIDSYTKEEVNNLLDSKADSSAIIDAYTKGEVNGLLADKVNTDDLIETYSKTEIDGLLADKADSSAIIDAYTKTETDNLLTAKVDTTALEQLEDALTDYATLEYLEEAKTDLENEIANIPKVTKTSELTNDSGFITINDIPEIDIPEVDLTPYALKTQIPTTLPASDVYDWAKEATKPTYTASEVGALASNGTAVNASKVANALTISLNGTSQGAYNGSSAKNINITASSVGALPNVGAGGVNELGQFLDLHKGGSSADYDARIYVNENNHIVCTDASGTFGVNYEISNLKSTVVSGKTSVANAINGKLGTTLSNQTSFADMAYYIGTIPSMASVGSLPNSSEFIQINLPVTREVLGGNTLALNQTVTIDGGLIMFVCDDDRESLRITPINAPIKVYGRADTTKTVNAGTSFSTDGYEWFIVNPSRTQLSCTRVGLYDFGNRNPAINISIS